MRDENKGYKGHLDYLEQAIEEHEEELENLRRNTSFITLSLTAQITA